MINIKNMGLLSVMTICFSALFAQQERISRPLRFQSINNIGLLEGQAGSAFQLQTVNGAQYKSWFAGVGIGLDYYRYRTIPLFLDVRKEFGKRSNKLFIYADAGMNFYWERDKDVKQFPVDDKIKNGFYGEAGVGYMWKLNQRMHLIFNAGYSYKNFTEKGTYLFMNPILANMSYPVEKINNNLNRLVLKVGIEF
jgi:hypothetical protein